MTETEWMVRTKKRKMVEVEWRMRNVSREAKKWEKEEMLSKKHPPLDLPVRHLVQTYHQTRKMCSVERSKRKKRRKDLLRFSKTDQQNGKRRKWMKRKRRKWPRRKRRKWMKKKRQK
jgi:hypothetical protein